MIMLPQHGGDTISFDFSEQELQEIKGKFQRTVDVMKTLFGAENISYADIRKASGLASDILFGDIDRPP